MYREKMNLNKDVQKAKHQILIGKGEMKALKRKAAKKVRANARQAIRTGNYDKVYNFVGVTGWDVS